MELNKQNFIQLINANRGTIRSLCQAYFRGDEDQKDAFQDIILQLWKSFESYEGRAAVNTWIYKVSLNTLLTKIRKEKKSVAAEPIDTGHYYISQAKADDHVELLSLILQSLKETDKALVILHLEGYQNKEIADILNLSPSNVSTRFNRLKNHLKLKFKPKPHETK